MDIVIAKKFHAGVNRRQNITIRRVQAMRDQADEVNALMLAIWCIDMLDSDGKIL